MNALSCRAQAFAALAYVNYRATSLDNISLRLEFYDDMEGQRTTVKTRYVDAALSWQHWLSPQIEFRPEIAYYKSLDALAFNGNFNANMAGASGPIIPPNRDYAWIASMDVIWHF